MDAFLKAVREAMKQADWDQLQLGRAIGVSQARVSAMLSKGDFPMGDKTLALTEKLGLPIHAAVQAAVRAGLKSKGRNRFCQQLLAILEGTGPLSPSEGRVVRAFGKDRPGIVGALGTAARESHTPFTLEGACHTMATGKPSLPRRSAGRPCARSE